MNTENTENKESKELKKCSSCGCKKLLKFFNFRENTGQYYGTCIKCCERSKNRNKSIKNVLVENSLNLVLKEIKDQLVVLCVKKKV